MEGPPPRKPSGKPGVHGNPRFDWPRTLVYLDIEGTPNTRSNYLIGLMTVAKNGTESYQAFWADDEKDELTLFIKLLDHLDCETRYSLIHYGNYEIKALRQIRQKLPASYQIKVDDAITHSLNILSIIRPYIYFPTCSNSLKEIARYLRFDWRDPSSSGLQSLVWRRRWLEGE